MKRAITLILALVMVLSLASVAFAAEDLNADKNVAAVEGISEDAVLRVACDGEPDGLFPGYQQNKVDNRVNSAMFNYLTEWDDVAQTWKYSIATDHEWIDDTHVLFTIRDDVYFSNGELLVAEDVAKSLAYQVTEATHASYNYMFDPEGMEVVDDTHVIVALSEHYGNLLDILGCDYYTIFDWSAFEADGLDTAVWTRNPVGSGPYMLEEWLPGESITLVRNENYWDKDNMPYYQSIVFYFIADQASRASALEAGTVDVAFNVAVNQIEELEAAGITVNPYNQNVTSPLQFTMTNEAYPALAATLRAMLQCEEPQPQPHAPQPAEVSPLVVRVFSFSYKRGIPDDESGNGGGYVFDCRAPHNPGRYDEYKQLTGLDQPVIDFLERDGEIQPFLDNVYRLADFHVARYMERGFTNLMFSFGCTGGQHRSVYSAQHLAEHLHKRFGIEVRLQHREQGIARVFPAKRR